ncbi:GTP cyclohydrolase I FolE [Gryllotalpicola protaetiae]|uniref:GTP cyclohydrolase 1 n=1 Tax=Gryllotalpicola protaetiae TaxID=2419771 RepID=A0A387BGT0_9MICO|nr:GTP cyclohydrolase I FolE [Gryllotalpicola protaetiae]AYG03123.1 GTP cyclohydrolase I FolE [Gryllotalpicola protaetiae]
MTGIDRARVEAAVAELLAAIGEDPARPGLRETPSKVADAYAEFFSGLGEDPIAPLRETIPVGDVEPELVIVRDLEFRSVCEHHLLPFLGRAHLAYLPAEKVVGLGRLPQLVDTLAARPQLQERLTEQIADALVQALEPRGVVVVLDAQHQCVTTRGARQVHSTTVTVASRGELDDPVRRAEVITLIGSAAQ